MSRQLVLADTSVWVAHLTGRHTAVTNALQELLSAHRVAVNAVIRLELLTGARDEAQYAELDDALGGLHAVELTEAVWRQAERLRFDLRRRGRLIPALDVLIASCAMAYDCAVLHADRHFDFIARSAPLTIHQPA
ncbi:MAG: PIN domain-containing protein [Candidatus Omnitrophica bacterium]|nr:PIN domain-containing protein [Candidatus Omnitrophota bacterium]